MVGDELFAAQKSILANFYVKGRKDFLCCRKSYWKKPELVIFSSGQYYVDGLVTCKKGYCGQCVKSYLYKASQKMAKVNEFIQKENLCPTMLTLTLPHKATDELKSLKVTLDRATRGFLAESQNKLVKKINRAVGNVGYILRNEITYNDVNGWHTHCHIENLNRDNYSESQKNQLVDEFARQLESAGFLFSRLDKYNIEKNCGLIHFRENSFDATYLSKYDDDNPVNLAITQPKKYVEFAQSFNTSAKIPMIKFKNGLKSRMGISKEKNQREELRRIKIPEFLINQSPEYIEEWLQKELTCP